MRILYLFPLFAFLLCGCNGSAKPKHAPESDTTMNSSEKPPGIHIDYANVIGYERRTYAPAQASPNFIDIAATDIDQLLGKITRNPERGGAPLSPTDIQGLYDIGTELYSIKGVSRENYVALKYKIEDQPPHFWVFCANENAKERAIIDAMAKARKAKEDKAEQQAVSECDYPLDTPWPNRIIFNNTSYSDTRVTRENIIANEVVGQQIGKVKNRVKTEGSYPEDFAWKDGDASTYDAGTLIHAIKGIDTKYYILVCQKVQGVVSYLVFASDTQYNPSQAATVRWMCDEQYSRLEKARAYNPQLFQVGYSNNTAAELVMAQQAGADAVGNRPVDVTRITVDMEANPHFAFGAIPEGLFEVCFSPKREVHFYKKVGNEYVLDNRPLATVADNVYYQLFSIMIDEGVPELTDPYADTEGLKGVVPHLALHYANGQQKRLSVVGMPERFANAIFNLPRQVLSGGQTSGMGLGDK